MAYYQYCHTPDKRKSQNQKIPFTKETIYDEYYDCYLCPENEILKYSIPIPPLDEQVRIIGILDKFDALTNSITEGLPREIKLRQQQYEYYLDLLLRFPKPEEVR